MEMIDTDKFYECSDTAVFIHRRSSERVALAVNVVTKRHNLLSLLSAPTT